MEKGGKLCRNRIQQFMVALASASVIPPQQAVLFYLHCNDPKKKRAELEGSGIPVGPLSFLHHRSSGEFRVEDHDGYVLMITHLQETKLKQ